MLFYRLMLLLSWPVLPVVLLVRILTGKDSVKTAMGRLALGPGRAAQPGVLWLHAASLGEFNTLALLLDPLRAALPGARFLITTGNRIAHQKSQALAGPDVALAIAPLDHGSVVARFLRRWQPRALITIENEVYPNRILAAKARGMAVIYVNARMSEKSHAGWARRPALARPVFAAIDLCQAQDEASRARFADLGVVPERLSCPGNLKQFQAAAAPDHPDLARLTAQFTPEHTLLAASTHKGEEEIILQAFAQAHRDDPALRLILAPRHPRRGDEVAALIRAAGLGYARRSAGQMPGPQEAVYLADTTGEMALWYSLAAVTFVAGSLVGVGGHTPYEPAAHGSALLHGPLYSNFEAIYSALRDGGGSREVADAEALVAAWAALRDAPTRAAQVARARTLLFDGADRARILAAVTDPIRALL